MNFSFKIIGSGSAIISLPLLITFLSWSCSKSFTVKDNIETNYSNENWTLYGGDASRANYRTKTVAPPLHNIWTYKATSAISPTLVTVNGILYLTTLDGRLDAVDIATGERIGRTKLQDNLAAACTYFKGDLYIASRYGEKTLARYNLATGKYLWRIDAGDIASEPLVTEDGIYISGLYQHIDKYALSTGTRKWTFKTDDQHRSSPALAKNTVVAGCDNGSIYALNAKTGALKWKTDTGASVFATPVINGDKVYVGSTDSVFYALDLANGSIDWRFKAGSPLYQIAATDGKSVVFGASNGRVYSLNAENGELNWQFEAKSVISTAPVISGEVVYFGSLDHRYYCLSLEAGQELWNFITRGRIRTSPVVWRKYVFGASEDKYLYAFAQPDSIYK